MTRNRFQPIRGFRKTAKDLFLWIKEWFHHSKKVLFVYQSLQARGFSKPSVYLVNSTTFLLIPQKSVQTRFPASKVLIPSKVQIRKNHPNDMAGSDWPWTNFGRWELREIELIENFFSRKKSILKSNSQLTRWENYSNWKITTTMDSLPREMWGFFVKALDFTQMTKYLTN